MALLWLERQRLCQDGKNVKLAKTEWDKILDQIKDYKADLDEQVKENKKLSKENTTLTEHVSDRDDIIAEMKQERGCKSRKSATPNNRKDEQKEDVDKDSIY